MFGNHKFPWKLESKMEGEEMIDSARVQKKQNKLVLEREEIFPSSIFKKKMCCNNREAERIHSNAIDIISE